MATSPDGKRAFVALADACQVAVVDTARGAVVARVATSAKPTGLVLDPHSGRLYVTCGHPTGVVDAIDTNIMQKVMTIPVGHTATGAILTPDGSRLFVCNRFNNDVSVLSLPDGKELARVKAVREPVGGAVTPDGKTVFVINLLPDEAADNDTSAAVVTAIDAAHLTTVGVRLPNGSSSARGICVSPDGKQAYVAHVLSRNALPATQLERGWMNTNAVSILDRARRSSLARFFSTTSISARRTPGGSRARRTVRLLCVAHSGTHEVSVLDLKGVLAKFAQRQESLRTPTQMRPPAPPQPTGGVATKWEPSVISPPLDPTNDLSFLAGLRHRVSLPGKGPRGLAIAAGKLYVPMYFSDTLIVVDLRNPTSPASVATIALGPALCMTEARHGEMVFHDATLCFQHWHSCATCHPDARRMRSIGT